MFQLKDEAPTVPAHPQFVLSHWPWPRLAGFTSSTTQEKNYTFPIWDGFGSFFCKGGEIAVGEEATKPTSTGQLFFLPLQLRELVMLWGLWFSSPTWRCCRRHSTKAEMTGREELRVDSKWSTPSSQENSSRSYPAGAVQLFHPSPPPQLQTTTATIKTTISMNRALSHLQHPTLFSQQYHFLKILPKKRHHRCSLAILRGSKSPISDPSNPCMK